MNFVRTSLLALALAVPMAANAAGAFSDDVEWTLPTSRVDGTPLPVEEIDRIELEVILEGSVLYSDAFLPSITSFTFQRPTPPNYTLCYRARTVDTAGLMSDWTAEVCKTVQGNPNPPRIDRVR